MAKRISSHFPFSSRTQKQLHESLKEDIGKGDVTSEVLVPLSANGRAVVVAREGGVLCGVPVVKELFRISDPGLQVKPFQKTGTSLRVKGG
jgi:nicotinate-nucleotide pyrophosphorylase (carboxylating)